MTSWKTWAARAACVLMLAGAAQPFYLRMFTAVRARYARMLAAAPYAKAPTLRPFCEGVRTRTKDGDRIAIVVPDAYAFYRAAYLLAGRTIVPPQELPRADFVACWHTGVAIPGFTPVWTTPDGTLLRRTR